MSPRIAVVIPYFQRSSGVLARTLNAVFAQEVDASFEVIIADDESPVPAARELAALSAADQARTRIVVRRNGGPAAARNTGLAAVGPDTEFVALLDSDDLWQPHHLAHAMAAFALGYDYYFSDHCREGRAGSRFTDAGLRLEDHRLIDPANDIYAWRTDLFDTVLRAPIIGMSNIVFRRAALPKIRFDEAVGIVDDWYFHLQTARSVAHVAFSPAVDVVCTEADNLSGASDWRSNKSLRMIVALSLLYRRVLCDFPLTPEQRSFTQRRWHETRRSFATTVMAMLASSVSVDRTLVARLLRRDPLVLGQFPLVIADGIRRRAFKRQ
jgi:succinoglycan biosynthesis protein ExoW